MNALDQEQVVGENDLALDHRIEIADALEESVILGVGMDLADIGEALDELGAPVNSVPHESVALHQPGEALKGIAFKGFPHRKFVDLERARIVCVGVEANNAALRTGDRGICPEDGDRLVEGGRDQKIVIALHDEVLSLRTLGKVEGTRTHIFNLGIVVCGDNDAHLARQGRHSRIKLHDSVVTTPNADQNLTLVSGLIEKTKTMQQPVEALVEV